MGAQASSAAQPTANGNGIRSVRAASSGDDKNQTIVLVPQRHFEGTIHRRYIKDSMVTLEFQDQFWSTVHDHTIDIKDITNNKVLFRVPPPRAPAPGEVIKRRLVLDTYGVPVVGMEALIMLPEKANCTEYTVIPGGYAATNEIFRFTTRINAFDFPLELAFNEESQEERIRIVVTNRWLARTSLVCIQRGRIETIYKIASVYKVDGSPEGQYRMDIAPGVDLSLMVLLAAAMDEQSFKHMTSMDRRSLKRQSKSSKKALIPTEACP